MRERTRTVYFVGGPAHGKLFTVRDDCCDMHIAVYDGSERYQRARLAALNIQYRTVRYSLRQLIRTGGGGVDQIGEAFVWDKLTPGELIPNEWHVLFSWTDLPKGSLNHGD